MWTTTLVLWALAGAGAGTVAAPAPHHLGSAHSVDAVPRAAEAISIPLRSTSRRYHPDAVVRDAARSADAANVRARFPERLGKASSEKRKRDLETAEHTLAKRADAGTGLTNWFRDSVYSVPVSIGTPPQVFDLQLDTGSPALWLFDRGCGAAACSTVPKFNSMASSTFREQPGVPFDIGYLDGSFAEGRSGVDVVSVAGVALQNATFGLASNVTASMGWDSSTMAGLMGFGWPIDDYSNIWAQQAVASLPEPVFSIHVGRDPEHLSLSNEYAHAEVGSLMLGGTNASLYDGEIEYLPLTIEGWWQVELSGLAVNGVEIDIRQDGNSTPDALMDTGTGLVYGPKKAVAALYAAIPGAELHTDDEAEGYIFPCPTSNSNLSIAFTFGKTAYAMPAVDAWYFPAKDREGWCRGTIVGQDASELYENSWIMGDAFLKSVYSVYRYSPPAVGLARVKRAADNAGEVQQGLNEDWEGAAAAKAEAAAAEASATTPPLVIVELANGPGGLLTGAPQRIAKEDNDFALPSLRDWFAAIATALEMA